MVQARERGIKVEKRARVSESIRLGTLLTFVGGFLDAYSYLTRGGVFANAETGNIVLMGIHLAQGQWRQAIFYLFPIACFALGIFAAEWFKKHVGEKGIVSALEGERPVSGNFRSVYRQAFCLSSLTLW